MSEHINEQIEKMPEQTKGNGIGKLLTKKVAIIGGVAGIAVAAVVGLGIYNAPVNRLNRQLDLAHKYLEEQDFEQAVIAFNEAIEIDERCIEAYAGGIEAYLQSGNTEELSVFYEKALEVVRSASNEEMQGNTDDICAIYGAADEVYDDLNKSLEILEEGRAAVGEIPEAEDIETDLSNTLTEYLDKLLSEKNYAEAKTLIEKHKSDELDVDLNSYLATVEKEEKAEAEKVAFLSEVYKFMENGEAFSLTNWTYKKEVATPFVQNMESDCSVYIPEDAMGLNGLGVGVYKFGVTSQVETPYYFYYGYYKDGVRQGEGISLYNFGDAMTVLFEGNWENDAPNGEGKEATYGPNGDVYVSGNLVNGLWDGEVSTYCDDWFEGTEYFMTWSASNGVPSEDKTSEYASLYAPVSYNTTANGGEVIASGGFFTRGYDYEALKEDEYIYAYDQKRYLWTTLNSTIGVLGYGTEWEDYGKQWAELELDN